MLHLRLDSNLVLQNPEHNSGAACAAVSELLQSCLRASDLRAAEGQNRHFLCPPKVPHIKCFSHDFEILLGRWLIFTWSVCDDFLESGSVMPQQ